MAVKARLAAMKKEVNKEEAQIMESFIQMVNDHWHKASPSKRASLPDLAAKYGLPVKLAGKWKDDNLLSCIAVAAFRAL